MSIQLLRNYYSTVEQAKRYGGSWNGSSWRKPFQYLLEQYARSKNLVPAAEVGMRISFGDAQGLNKLLARVEMIKIVNEVPAKLSIPDGSIEMRIRRTYLLRYV